MPNTIKTNSLTELVAIRAAESASYLTVGSKKYFKDQLVGKRNGQTYKFVIRDTGAAVNSLAANLQSDKITVTEREVAFTLDPWHVLVETNAIEKITDVDWDPEIAEPNGQKLINACVKKVMNSDLGKAGTAFIGSGFAPMARAAAHLKSITNEELFGFCDPNVEAILTSNGQAFTPVDAPALYSKGLLGKFHGVEYRAQRFFPSVVISTGSEFDNGAVTVTSYTAGTAYDTIVLGATTLTSSIKKGTPIFLEGVYACDTVGDPTANEHAFIVLEDATASSNAITLKVGKVDMTNSTRDIAKADGSDWTAATLAGLKVAVPDDGKYFMGIVRANGAMEFETLDKLDAAGADYEKQTVNGLSVHQNRLVDMEKMTNYTRWDIVTLAGVVDGRAVSVFYIK